MTPDCYRDAILGRSLDAYAIQGGRGRTVQRCQSSAAATATTIAIHVATTSSDTLWSRFPATLAASAKWGSAGKLYLGLERASDPD